MKFWVDAQLPPMLANWLSTQFDVEALSLRDLGLRDSTDSEIFKAAQQAKVVVVSKDGGRDGQSVRYATAVVVGYMR